MGHGQTDRVFGTDANGCLTEHTDVGGHPVVVHCADIPESDITTVRGLRCTTPLRTVIDVAADAPHVLRRIIEDFLGRDLFTVDEARRRLAEPDLATHPGARVVRAFLRS